MTLRKQVPNFITLLNLLSGSIAVYFAANNALVLAAYFILLGIFFDFFDGFTARLLKVQGELGKQLDSLADMVTSGVAPGIVMMQLLLKASKNEHWDYSVLTNQDDFSFSVPFLISLIGLLITLGAAYRLAKFNLDERQTSSFIGLPTPAAALVVISFPLILAYSDSYFSNMLIENTWFLIGITLILTFLMNAEIPLFSLKFKNFEWKKDVIKVVFIVITILFIIIIKFMAIPMIILVYVILSLIENSYKKLHS
ncbi:CDP-alcohol phosphatidyltransferase family protein [Lutibacter sp.]|uniref:CDP-alcohol phosphatidyltransferase family protein n=1 Tax=Lutibacter sp. TaxID=1925666 RepID=UPI0025C3E012|nr:CDP-alcohol phosphatidyltransferase family protein [Lutibacter sp.]MCF6181323.1 CDP-alcohol phosphatidyltransferase family protein [Lutibacter sp.]